MKFKLTSDYRPAGGQPKAIQALTEGLKSGKEFQTLLGVTGSGKTYSIANVIQNAQRPVLVMSHNKTLAAQLYQEFRDFFPNNQVHYFVSYYDYYQPEAYMPAQDVYIEKDAMVNDEIDRLRHGATQALLSHNDVIIVASVSCIYGIGSPDEYKQAMYGIEVGEKKSRKEMIDALVDLGYTRNQTVQERGTFRVKGEVFEIVQTFSSELLQIIIEDSEITKILKKPMKFRTSAQLPQQLRGTFNAQVDQKPEEVESDVIFSTRHYVTPEKTFKKALSDIDSEMKTRVAELEKGGKTLEAHRLKQRTEYDLEMLEETGFCSGVENYSRHFEQRASGTAPYTLIDFFDYAYGDDWLLVVDESHMTIPQVRGMYHGDVARKNTLVEYGFRLPSARDNRPLKFSEFMGKIHQTLFMSATPAEFELKKSKFNVVEQVIRPTGLLDPEIEVRTLDDQAPDVIKEIKAVVKKGQRALVTTITKRLAEDIAEFLRQNGIKAYYLHSDVKTLERPEILKKLRQGEYDCIVGINLLREGIDLPEVSLVVILDADKEGFLRNDTTLIQTMGRAARHPEGKVLMYAQHQTDSMKRAIRVTTERRKYQEEYNKEHGITPTALKKKLGKDIVKRPKEEKEQDIVLPPGMDKADIIKMLDKEMMRASDAMEFEKAAQLRDKIKELEGES